MSGRPSAQHHKQMSSVATHLLQREHAGALGHPGTSYAQLRETHIGVVLLLGDRAYKFKKPVDIGFLDFTDRDRRAACCRREVELNRRLAADVYLGTGRLTDPDGMRSEPVVVMRRMPDDRRLSTLIAMGADVEGTVVRLARMLAAFHAGADRSPAISAQGSADAVRARWSDCFRQVEQFQPGGLHSVALAEIRDRALEFLAGRGALFERRIAQHRIVDGHGDLICDDIFCLDDGPRVLDCLEFDDDLRYLDGLDDIAFLAMDLEKLGEPELAGVLLQRYADFAGDPAPRALRHHYVAYRAFVRVRVDCLRSAQGDPAAAADARRCADLALRHLRAGAVRMVLIGGPPGAGKSTIAGALADAMGAALLSSDRIRKELHGLSPLQPAPQPYLCGVYDTADTADTYREMITRATGLVAHGESVVLDASWTDTAGRAAAAVTAKAGRAELVQVNCAAPAEVRLHRLRSRPPGPSDADAGIAQRMAAAAAPWPAALTVSTIGTVQDTVTGLLGHMMVRVQDGQQ